MVKIFCDRCGKEITNDEKCEKRCVFRDYHDGNTFAIEAIECVGQTWNGGALCTDCVRAIVAEGEVSYKLPGR